MNLCCEADPKGKSQGRDLQRNSPQQGRNQCFVSRDYKKCDDIKVISKMPDAQMHEILKSESIK